MADQGANSASQAPGLAARRIAVELIEGVLRQRRALDEQLEGRGAHQGLAGLSDRDRALTRRLVGTVLRRLGTLRRLLAQFVERGLPAAAPRVESVLLIGAAQILWLDVPDHAAVDLSVRLAREDRRALHYAPLVNAVLRRVAREGVRALTALDDASLDTPPWLMRRWERNYGVEIARAIALAHRHEPALDFTVREDPARWAAAFGGRVLPTGSVRAIVHGPVSQLPGFGEGAWWVQDAAAALPAKLLGDVRGKRIADLCAAPGGKTAQLAAAGAQVTAVDRADTRLVRLRQNLARLTLHAETLAADATQWKAGPFDAVLLDAPCTSTGTIRRHPDVPWLKREADIEKLSALQHRLLTHAIDLVKPGGTLVYCTCSLEPEEGSDVVSAVLDENPHLRRRPIAAAELGGIAEFVTPQGDLRTLPCQLTDPDPRMSGLDGFFAARLERL